MTLMRGGHERSNRLQSQAAVDTSKCQPQSATVAVKRVKVEERRLLRTSSWLQRLHYAHVTQLSQTLSIASPTSLYVSASVRVCGPSVRKCDYQQGVRARIMRVAISGCRFHRTSWHDRNSSWEMSLSSFCSTASSLLVMLSLLK